MNEEEVRYTELLPYQFRKRLAARAIAYLPMGTLEWHGEHLPLGSDAIISEGLMIECARRLGGIVLPPIHLGPSRARLEADGSQLQGMDYISPQMPPRRLEGSAYWVSQGLFLSLIDSILAQLARAGFRGVFADGHGPSRRSWVSNLEDCQLRFGLKFFGVTEEFRERWRSQIDHAARNETSLVMALRPDLVDLAKLGVDRSIWPQGVGGEDPRDATVEHGKQCIQDAVALVEQMFQKAGL